jgi:molybdopterin converting factor small subunit
MGKSLRININIYMDLAKKLGWKNIELVIDKEKTTFNEILSTVKDLKDAIINQLDDYIILINGLNIKLLKGLETEILGDTTIDIFPPAAGGDINKH